MTPEEKIKHLESLVLAEYIDYYTSDKVDEEVENEIAKKLENISNKFKKKKK